MGPSGRDGGAGKSDGEDVEEELDVFSLPDAEREDDEEFKDAREFKEPRMWRLVWCKERVHKQDNQVKRRTLTDLVERAKASMVCFKNVGKFRGWLSTKPRPPYVLLTDWREAKPSMHLLESEEGFQSPLFVVVVTEDKHAYERAAAWAANRSHGQLPVYVYEGTDLLKVFLSNLADCFAYVHAPVVQLLEQSFANAVAWQGLTTLANGLALGASPDGAHARKRHQTKRSLGAGWLPGDWPVEWPAVPPELWSLPIDVAPSGLPVNNSNTMWAYQDGVCTYFQAPPGDMSQAVWAEAACASGWHDRPPPGLE